MIDLRSDTITVPTAQMRKAIADCEVGDAVLDEDPTVNQLQRRTAEILGKDAAIYLPSGTMCNQVAVRSHTQPGDEMIAEAGAHIHNAESNASAALSGVLSRTINGDHGIFTADQLKAAVRADHTPHGPKQLVCLENTHNRGGGNVWPIERLAEISAVARENGFKMHLDGARLWNASAATGIPESEYTSYFDSISVCFSKGLGAPVGSALVGSSDFISRASRFRRQFGGGMRQAGIIAAGALHALEHHRQRLTEDHDNARMFARGLAEFPGVELDVANVKTNIICFDLTDVTPHQFVEQLAQRGVGMFAFGPKTVRAVTNMTVSRDDVEAALGAVREVMAAHHARPTGQT